MSLGSLIKGYQHPARTLDVGDEALPKKSAPSAKLQEIPVYKERSNDASADEDTKEPPAKRSKPRRQSGSAVEGLSRTMVRDRELLFRSASDRVVQRRELERKLRK